MVAYHPAHITVDFSECDAKIWSINLPVHNPHQPLPLSLSEVSSMLTPQIFVTSDNSVIYTDSPFENLQLCKDAILVVSFELTMHFFLLLKYTVQELCRLHTLFS